MVDRHSIQRLLKRILIITLCFQLPLATDAADDTPPVWPLLHSYISQTQNQSAIPLQAMHAAHDEDTSWALPIAWAPNQITEPSNQIINQTASCPAMPTVSSRNTAIQERRRALQQQESTSSAASRRARHAQLEFNRVHALPPEQLQDQRSTHADEQRRRVHNMSSQQLQEHRTTHADEQRHRVHNMPP